MKCLWVILSALASVAVSEPVTAADFSGRLICKISGEAGCSSDDEGKGVCVGAGTKDSTITLEIDAEHDKIFVNGISGELYQKKLLGADLSAKVLWKHSLVALDNIHLSQNDVGVVSAQLFKPPEDLEFSCAEK